jgi:hypothetical protein
MCSVRRLADENDVRVADTLEERIEVGCVAMQRMRGGE